MCVYGSCAFPVTAESAGADDANSDEYMFNEAGNGQKSNGYAKRSSLDGTSGGMIYADSHEEDGNNADDVYDGAATAACTPAEHADRKIENNRRRY